MAKLTYVVGDLVKAAQSGQLDVIAHGCNCFNTMKSGIAPQIAKAFPFAHQADQNTQRGDRHKLGGYTYASYTTGLYVFNLYSQYGFWGRKEGIRDLDYQALEKALEGMANELKFIADRDGKEVSNMRVGLPKIGAGLAGGNWDFIELMVEKHLGCFDTKIYVLHKREIPDA